MAPPTEPVKRPIVRDEEIAAAAELDPGPGTYLEGDVIRALFDGELTIEGGTCSVARPRREIARRRLRRGESTEDAPGIGRNSGLDGDRSAHRHGVGKHGRPRAKPKKGRGDQGAWD